MASTPGEDRRLPRAVRPREQGQAMRVRVAERLRIPCGPRDNRGLAFLGLVTRDNETPWRNVHSVAADIADSIAYAEPPIPDAVAVPVSMCRGPCLTCRR